MPISFKIWYYYNTSKNKKSTACSYTVLIPPTPIEEFLYADIKSQKHPKKYGKFVRFY
jgi:hypothetical protein